MIRVSVIVLNYNYARFLSQAIESALAQTYADCEVVVVDNGSTDDSIDVARGYGSRIRLVRQDINIGQGQGYNLGFERARGDWLIWLDADDLLLPDAIETCMGLVQDDTAKLQFPLELIDSEGKSMGTCVPYLRHSGDVAPIIRRFGHYAGPPGSGNLYRRSAIARYFPVRPQDWPICTDTVPFVTAPFHGRVVDTGRALGCYRIHNKAASAVPGYQGNYSASMAQEVRLNAAARDKSLALLHEHAGIEVCGPFLTLPPHVRNRVVSWRLASDTHPYEQDSARSLWRLMSQSLAECPGYQWPERLLMRLWTAGVLFAPASLARSLAGKTRRSGLWRHALGLIRPQSRALWTTGPGPTL